jgi:putative ABC transport system substrate-binding protein
LVVALAAKAATATIPIVFTCGTDPVRAGLVASLDRPGGNVTGVSYFVTKLGPERLEWLRQFVPHATTIAVLVNPTNSTATASAITDIQAAALSVRQQVIVLSTSTTTEIDDAFATMAKHQAGGRIVNGDRFLSGQSDQLIALAARYRIPAIYFTRSFVEAGGLMSYGDDRFESWLMAAYYIGRILKGETPAGLSVIQPIKLELASTAKPPRRSASPCHGGCWCLPTR